MILVNPDGGMWTSNSSKSFAKFLYFPVHCDIDFIYIPLLHGYGK